MPYDHSVKIGNEGDLVKHVVLYAAIQQSVRLEREGTPYRYAESNAGRPQYVLPSRGEWRRGIGKFSINPQLARYRQMLNTGEVSEVVNACVGFDSEFLGRRVSTGMMYPGSAGLAFRLLRKESTSFNMLLWELDAAAADECLRFFYPWSNQVTINNADGYKGLMAAGNIHLALNQA